MKKITTLFVIIFVSAFFIKTAAQEYPVPIVVDGKPGDPLYGISKNMVYETIIESTLSKKEIIARTMEVLKTIGFTDAENVKLKDITDKQQQFSFRTGYRSGTFAGKGKSAVSKRLKSPVVLIFDLKFDFYESGKVKIQFSNFNELAFFKINNLNKFHIEAGMGSMLTPGVSVSDERHTKLNEIESKVMTAGTAFGKFTTVMESGGVNFQIKLSAKGFEFNQQGGGKEELQKMKTDVDEEWKVLDKAVEDKIGIWATPVDNVDFLGLYLDHSAKQKQVIEDTKKRMTEDVLMVVDNDRFERYFEEHFNKIFLITSLYIDGKIVGIAKDGTIRYEVNDKYEIKKVANKKQ